MTFTCSCKLALTKLNMSAPVSEAHQAVKSRTIFPLVSKPVEFPLLQWAAPLHLLLLSLKVLNTECFTQLLVSLKPTSHLENVCVGC